MEFRRKVLFMLCGKERVCVLLRASIHLQNFADFHGSTACIRKYNNNNE